MILITATAERSLQDTIQTFGLDEVHEQKWRHSDAAGGPMGRWSGARLSDSRARPLLLPRDGDGLRFGGHDRGSPLLSVP